MSIESTNFQTRLDNMTVESLINACTGQTATRRINLDATYQRKFVWEESDQSAFIDSVCKGIIPSNIIFNKKSKEQIVIDGKQRLTSLIRYFSNEIPLINLCCSQLFKQLFPITCDEKLYQILLIFFFRTLNDQ